MKKPIINNKNGSVTVEACIAFPVFLCFFFLLIFFIKTACISILLDHAVNETARQLAASCYPLSFLNELEDELLQEGMEYNIPSYGEELAKIKGYIEDNLASEDMLAKLLTGEITADDAGDIIDGIVGNIADDFKDGVRGYFVDRYAKKYYDLKTQVKYFAAKKLMDKFTKESIIDKNHLRLILVELPQGVAEFEIKSRYEDNVQIYKELGLSPDSDNVVIAVEYRSKIPLPFSFGKEIVTRHVAVEKAWIHGSYGIYAVDDASDDDEDANEKEEADDEMQQDEEEAKNKIVYVTKAGKKYHEADCEYIKRSKGYRALTLEDAIEEGKTPCKICILHTAEYVWKKRR